MAPQAVPVASTPTIGSAAVPSLTQPSGAQQQEVPIALLIFLGLCLVYTLSYILYRIVMARRRGSSDDVPDVPDRGVSQFMNGARLTLSFRNNQNATRAQNPTESPKTNHKEKPLTGSQPTPNLDVPHRSPSESSSVPFAVLVPSLTMLNSQELGGLLLERNTTSPPRACASTPASTTPPPPFSQRRVNSLSRDRAEAIALDPKLAPVQGPLRPLSIIPSPTRKKRSILFGLGLKHVRFYGTGDPETGTQAR